MKKTFEFTDENFKKEVLDSKIPVLVDFWADWCSPCKAMSSTIEELAVEFDGRFKVGKLDVDKNSDITSKLNILNIPTLIFFKGGKEMARMVGINPKPEIVKLIRELI